MRYSFIKEHRKIWPINLMCKVLQVHRSGYYCWLKKKTTSRARKEKELLGKIKQYYQESRGLYGSPRITRNSEVAE